jgi:hypothetical protein
MRARVCRDPSSRAAIQSFRQKDSGLLRRFTPRNDDGSSICSTLDMSLAMRTDFARRANSPQAVRVDRKRKSVADSRHPALIKRGASRSSRTLGAGCDGRGRCRYDERQRQRTAKSRGPDIPTLISSWRDHPPVMVARKPGSPGRARRKPLKPFAQGRPIAKGVPVVTEACVSFRFARKAMGAIFAPAFPAPSVLGRTSEIHGSGALRRESNKPWIDESKSLKTWQSRLSCTGLSHIAVHLSYPSPAKASGGCIGDLRSPSLRSKTPMLCIGFARNDGRVGVPTLP